MSKAVEISQVNPNWFIGRGNGVAFFGVSEEAVALKHWDYMQSCSTSKYATVRSGQTAEKLIQLESQLV